MEFLNICSAVTRTDAYVSCEPTERATWFNLLCYCATLENGGRIENCRDWKLRKWEQVAGVTEAEVKTECPLWTWDGDDIVVEFYPHESEAKVKSRSSAGRLGGLKSGLVRAARSKNEAPEFLLQAKNEAENEAPELCLNKTERNRTELNQTEPNGMEGKETREALPNPPPPPPVTTTETASSLDDLTRYQQIINLLSPSWSKLPTWGCEDNHALSENLENLRQLQRQDWQKLAFFFHWANSTANTNSRDPEKLTSKRSSFLQNLSSYLERAQRTWKSNGSPPLEKAVGTTATAPPKPATAALPEFESPAARALYFRSLLPEKPALS